MDSHDFYHQDECSTDIYEAMEQYAEHRIKHLLKATTKMTNQQQYQIELAEGKHPKDKAKRFLKAFIEGSKTFDDAKHHAALLINALIGAGREEWIKRRWYEVLDELEKIEEL